MTQQESLFISTLGCASLTFDLELGVVTNPHGESQRLSPINLKLLAYLLKHYGQVVSRTELFDAIWPNQLLSDDVLTRAISDVRTQLAKLDADTKYIETLPKRGYRWPIEVFPAMDAAKINVDSPLERQKHQEKILQPVTLAPAKSWMKIVSVHLCIAALLAVFLMWAVSQSATTQTIHLAVLPTVTNRPSIEPLAQAVDDALLNVLRKNAKVKLLSASAIKSRPQNPFPYFANEFGVSWVIESRVTDLDGINTIELNLVDAHTGVELRNLKIEITNRADILHKVAQKLESDLLVERLPY